VFANPAAAAQIVARRRSWWASSGRRHRTRRRFQVFREVVRSANAAVERRVARDGGDVAALIAAAPAAISSVTFLRPHRAQAPRAGDAAAAAQDPSPAC
jgi:hypothetical protein